MTGTLQTYLQVNMPVNLECHQKAGAEGRQSQERFETQYLITECKVGPTRYLFFKKGIYAKIYSHKH